jgi:2-polyprenyl-6-methoxyphenol hydroxylase-like FAD-dependent oxidoreductase
VTGRRALVIGGSVGGLFAAGLLRLGGWEVAVFERSTEDLAGRGAGIGTRADLFAILRRLGIALDPDAGVRVRSRICLDRAGHIVHERVVPAVNTAWDRIYRPLKDALPHECYRAGMRFEQLEQARGRVTAIFTDGTREAGDLLIGADGFSSTVRQIVLPEVAPHYAGYVAWRGVVEEGDLPPPLRAQLGAHFTVCLPEGELFLCLPLPGREGEIRDGSGRLYWGWFRAADQERALPDLCTDESGRCHGVTIPPPLIRRDVIAALKSHAADVLAPQLAAIVARTAQPLLQPIYDLAAPRIVFGRAVLLGDAAFVARPHVATGVTKAAQDAECLADALAAEADIDRALQSYDRARTSFGNAMVARGRELGAYLEASAKGEPAVERDPEKFLREYGAAGSVVDALYAAR